MIGDEPMIMFLVVAPHLEPTHTFRDETGKRLPERYNLTTADEYAATDHSEPMLTMARLASSALSQLASDAALAAKAFANQVVTLGEGGESAKSSLDASWTTIRTMQEQLIAFQSAWNALAQRISEDLRGAG